MGGLLSQTTDAGKTAWAALGFIAVACGVREDPDRADRAALKTCGRRAEPAPRGGVYRRWLAPKR
jgi:hypothetical protein